MGRVVWEYRIPQDIGNVVVRQREERTMAETAYCVKCKAKKEMKDAQKVTMKNGRPAMKGVCPTCGTGMYKILPVK